MDVGSGNRIGDGPGFPMSLGDGRRITTDAGSCMKTRGSGGRDIPAAIGLTIVQSGPRLTSRSLDSAAEVSRSVADSGPSVGFQSVRATAFIPGGVDTVRASTS